MKKYLERTTIIVEREVEAMNKPEALKASIRQMVESKREKGIEEYFNSNANPGNEHVARVDVDVLEIKD